MPIFLALNGPDKRDLKGNLKVPKAPSARDWSSEDHKGVDPAKHHGWLGLRTDGLVVVDCDTEDAAHLWRSIGAPTKEVKTPRGRHFYYRWTPGSPAAPAAGVFEHIDIRAGRGAQVVCPPTPGYEAVNDVEPVPFSPAWVQDEPSSDDEVDIDVGGDEWDVVPEGRRNETLAAIAGSLRRQGMSVEEIAYTLAFINKRTCVPPLDNDEIVTIAESAGRYEPAPDWSIEIEDMPPTLDGLSVDDIFESMRTMTLPPPAEWHWHPYLPKGRLVLMDGSEGIGKGLMCAHLATKLVCDEDVTVLWGSTEDDPEEDIQRRLLAAGYDRASEADVLFFKVDPKFPQDVTILERLIQETGAGFLVLDPGRSFLAPPDNVKNFSYNDESSIRPGLEALNKLAKRTGCTIVFVHHWNKNTQATVQYRSGGSGAFAQVVRHRITLAWVGPTDGGEGAFEVSKSNIGPKGNVHTYFVEPVLEFDTARLVLGDPDDKHDSLGAWMKTKEQQAEGVQIDKTEEVWDSILALPPTAQAPAREQLKEMGLSRREAQDLIDRALAEGVLKRGGRGGVQLFRTSGMENDGPRQD